MILTGERILPVARDRVWEALLDTATLKAAIPGCEEVTHEGEGRYRVSVVAAVGPVKARFKGRMAQEDLQPPQRYTLSFEGDGGMAGFAKGSAEVELTEVELTEGEGTSTRLAYRAQAQIGGRLAQIGSRLVDATAARLSEQFFERLTTAITMPPGAATATGTATANTQPLPLGVGEPVSPPYPEGVALAGTPAQAAWTGAVSITMPGWAWAWTVAAAALVAAWAMAH